MAFSVGEFSRRSEWLGWRSLTFPLLLREQKIDKKLWGNYFLFQGLNDWQSRTSSKLSCCNAPSEIIFNEPTFAAFSSNRQNVAFSAKGYDFFDFFYYKPCLTLNPSVFPDITHWEALMDVRFYASFKYRGKNSLTTERSFSSQDGKHSEQFQSVFAEKELENDFSEPRKTKNTRHNMKSRKMRVNESSLSSLSECRSTVRTVRVAPA